MNKKGWGGGFQGGGASESQAVSLEAGGETASHLSLLVGALGPQSSQRPVIPDTQLSYRAHDFPWGLRNGHTHGFLPKSDWAEAGHARVGRGLRTNLEN